jgi:hypothetical protein
VFYKLCLLVITFGVIGCCMLGLRQQRLEAVHEATVAQRNILLHSRDLAKLRTDIAAMSTPEKIELAAATRFGPLMAINVQTDSPASPIAPNGTTIVQAKSITKPAQAR